MTPTKTTDITLDDVRAEMKTVFKKQYNTPEKLRAKLLKDETGTVMVAARCPGCEKLFLEVLRKKPAQVNDIMCLYFYKNYYVWHFYFDCPECGETVTFTHSTITVGFDDSGLPDYEGCAHEPLMKGALKTRGQTE